MHVLSSSSALSCPHQLSEEAILSLSYVLWKYAATIEDCMDQLQFDFHTHTLDDAISVSTTPGHNHFY